MLLPPFEFRSFSETGIRFRQVAKIVFRTRLRHDSDIDSPPITCSRKSICKSIIMKRQVGDCCNIASDVKYIVPTSAK